MVCVCLCRRAWRHEVEHVEGAVLGSLHLLALAGAFIVLPAEVKYAVDDDAPQLARVALPEALGVGGYGVEAYDDVGIEVVTQKLAVDPQDLLVVGEDV